MDIETIEQEQSKRSKTIDSLGAEDQDKLLGLFKTTLLPNTEPTTAEIKQEQDEHGKTPDQHLSTQLEQLKIQHAWATVKVTPSRINGCL